MNNTNDLKKIENLICKFYKVKSFSQLGLGKIKHLKELTNSNEEINESIIYFDSILNKSDSMSPAIDFIDNKENQTFLINKLNECPLLENIQIYLEQFIDLDGIDLKLVINSLKNKLNQEQIYLLEIEPGVLLKLSKNTDIDFIKQAIEQGDYINACGHLVSLIAVKYKSLNQMPRSLLINEIESSMSIYYNTKCEQLSVFISFLIQFINRLPVKLVKNANKILFDYILCPAAKITNNKQIKKDIFHQLIQSNLNVQILFFIKIGDLCSIQEWSMKEYEQAKKQQIQQNKTIIKDLIMDNEMQEKGAFESAKIDLECEKGI
jgi:hypothetical protein